ncbi:MYND-type domain-containing protein [Mycena sanguinolenta]|uniref:MYND-type domain-containing protein n=1 Tax=Mycena sanguinolenta TaxID=230812 RepID=A0A8H7CUB7_9AGAR|nr:MYND-type domain-containing protein [Mycena sanguinolenta]
MDPRTTSWPAYKWPRDIDNFNEPWVPSPDSFSWNVGLPQVQVVVHESTPPSPERSRRNIFNILRLLKSRRGHDEPKHSFAPNATYDVPKGGEIPVSKWRAFAAYSRPVINGVHVHNTFIPHHIVHLTWRTSIHKRYSTASAAPVAQSTRSFGSAALNTHPFLHVRRSGPFPRANEPLPFPWECQLNRYLKRAVTGSAPLYWNLRAGDRAILYGGPNDVTIPLTVTDLAEPATYPLVTHMYISAVACTDAGFPWKFLIVNSNGIRVRDVVNAIVDNFHCFVFRSEYDNWGKARQRRAELEWNLRGGPSTDDGLRRLDYLCGQTCFRGLEYNPDRTGWILYMGSEW